VTPGPIKAISNAQVFPFLIAFYWLIPAAQAAEQGWHREPSCAWKQLSVRNSGKTGFERIPTAKTGILFTNSLDEWSATANRVLALGSGVAAGDYDGDGLADLFFCSLSGASKLYKNLGGFRFKDVTAEAGIICTNYICRGAVFADIDGDGNLDLLISTCGNGVICFKNTGKGGFTENTRFISTSSKIRRRSTVKRPVSCPSLCSEIMAPACTLIRAFGRRAGPSSLEENTAA
jgi:hypothetical protein